MFFWYLANLHDQNRDEMSATFSHRRRLYDLDIKLSSLILIIVNFLHDTRRGGKWGGCWIYVSLDWVKYLIIFPAGALFCDSILWQHFMTVWNLSDSIWDIFSSWRLLHVSVDNIICLYIICLYSHDLWQQRHKDWLCVSMFTALYLSRGGHHISRITA